MHFQAFCVGFITSLVMGIQAMEAPLEGYGVEELQWEVELTPGGEMVSATGTIQEVVAHLKELNPNFEQEYPDLISNNTEGQPDVPPPSPPSNLTKRYEIESYFCHGRWSWCEQSYIQEGIRYLRTVRGQPSNGPGPGNCGRVSCSWKASIWWCNDNTDTKTLGDFRDIADGAAHIDSNCHELAYRPGGIPVIVESGQVFYKDKWNVIVRYDSDNC